MPSNKDKIALIKPKPASVQLLERQLRSSDPEVRKAGYVSIPKLNPNAPVEPLTDCIAAAFDHQNWYVKRCASEAVCKATQSKGAADVSIQKVAGARLTDADAEVRRCAAEGLVRIVEEATADDAPRAMLPEYADAAAQEVAARLTHQEPRVRQNAVEALSRMGSTARQHIPAAMRLINDSDVSVRNAVALRLCGLLGPMALDGISVVADSLRHENKELRRSATKAVHTLAQHSGGETAAAVAGQLQLCRSGEERRYILIVLTDLKELAAPHGKVIADLLEDPEAHVRASVARTLVAAGPKVAPSSLKHVKRRLEHEDADVRRAAMNAMRALAPMCQSYAQAAGKVLHEEEADRNQETLRYRIAVLTILGGAAENAEPYLENLTDSLNDQDWGVRRAAVEALVALGEHASSVAAEVARRLLHAEPDVRRAAAECLGRMGIHSGAYAGHIEGLLETEEDEDVKRACEAAIAQLQRVGALGGAAAEKLSR